MPDVIIGLLFELAHLFFELVFISFEWLESLLDHIVEHLLHTELHETQTIVFYILLTIAALPLYYLWVTLRRFFTHLKEILPLIWTQYKTYAIIYWQDLSLIDKIKVLAITVIVIYLASFMFM
jgi:hypothetical protein